MEYMNQVLNEITSDLSLTTTYPFIFR
jgi:hypothetical protein